jgi:hypothetical protein
VPDVGTRVWRRWRVVRCNSLLGAIVCTGVIDKEENRASRYIPVRSGSGCVRLLWDSARMRFFGKGPTKEGSECVGAECCESNPGRWLGVGRGVKATTSKRHDVLVQYAAVPHRKTIDGIDTGEGSGRQRRRDRKVGCSEEALESSSIGQGELLGSANERSAKALWGDPGRGRRLGEKLQPVEDDFGLCRWRRGGECRRCE